MEYDLPLLQQKEQFELEAILTKMIAVSRASKGTLQMYHRKSDLLVIVAQSGFTHAFLDHFRDVRPFDGSACGRAAGTGITINVSDVTKDAAFRPHKDIALAAGVRAVQSFPLFDDGQLLGVMSVHFNDVKHRLGNDRSVNAVVADAVRVLGRVADCFADTPAS